MGPHVMIGTQQLDACMPWVLENWAKKWYPMLQDIDLPCRFVICEYMGMYKLNAVPTKMLAKVLAENSYGKPTIVVLDAEFTSVSFKDLDWIWRELVSIGVDLRTVIMWADTVLEQGCPMVRGQSITGFNFAATTNAAVMVPEPTHHFIMLARVPRLHRIQAAVGILQRKLERLGYLSCGSGAYHPDDYDYFNHVPEDIRHRFPLLLDGEIDTADYQKVHLNSVLDLRVSGAFVNVVCETNSENPNESHTRRTIHITEKSSKPFLLGQCILMNGTCGTLAAIREFGFDCFDDLIDHSYDLEPDQTRRIGMMLDQLAMLCSKSMDWIQAYKQDNYERFVNNRDIFMSIAANVPGINQDRFLTAATTAYQRCISLTGGTA